MSGNSKIEWSAVPTHAGYFASADGRVRGPSGRVLRPMLNASGYQYVLTPLPRRPRKLFVHRAVLLAWVGSPSRGQEARHLDGDPSNNALPNLAWGTRLENTADRRRHGTIPAGESSPSARLTVADVAAIKADPRTSRVVGADYSISHTAVLRIRRGQSWRSAA